MTPSPWALERALSVLDGVQGFHLCDPQDAHDAKIAIIALALDAAALHGAERMREAAARSLRAYAIAGHGKDGGILSAAAARTEGMDPARVLAGEE